MNFLKSLIKQILITLGCLCFSYQVLAQLSQGVRLVDALTNEGQIIRLLARNGVDNAPAKNISDSVMLSWRALASGGSQVEFPSPRKLQALIRSINTTDPYDMRIKRQLESLLSREVQQVSKDDIATAVNHLIYMANRHGSTNSLVMACSSCVSNNLTRNGFKYTLEVVTNTDARKVLQEILPDDPQALRRFIQTRMRNMGLGDYSRVPASLVSPEDERALGLFLGLAEHGSSKQRELVNAIFDVSRNSSGDIQLFSSSNPHKLWKLFINDLDEASMDHWIRALRHVANETQEGTTKKEAFFTYLTREFGDDVSSREKINRLRAQRCFFQ